MIVSNESKCLEVKNLEISFHNNSGVTNNVVSDLTYNINQGETFALVGESGSGKTISSLAILGLSPYIGAEIISGQIIFKGRPIHNLNEKDFSKIRGNTISMIFQEPQSALNPAIKIKDQMIEALRIHQDLSIKDALKKSQELLQLTGIKDCEQKINSWPHELSGGQKQRVLIAMGIANNPHLIIADEPTTALDVTMQSQILDLLCDLQKKLNMSLLLITHDLRVVKDTAHRVGVMYAGTLVEDSSVDELFENPCHPYTKALLRAIPSLKKREKLITIPGAPPSSASNTRGCSFAKRCSYAMPVCFEKKPGLSVIKQSPYKAVKCHLF